MERKFHKVSCDLFNADFFVKDGFLGYVCDAGLWFRYIKYGNTWHKENLDKVIATGILQGKENNIAPRLAIYFNLTSADKSWWINCTDISLMDSEISDNRLLIIQTPTSITTKQWTEILQVSGLDPAWNKYLQQQIDHQDNISAMMLWLIL